MRPSGMSGSGAKSLSSKPNFGISGKKSGGAFAKPGFAMMGPKKTVGAPSAGPPVISKASFNPVAGAPKMNFARKRQQDDEFLDNELAQIQQRAPEVNIEESIGQPPAQAAAQADRLLDSEDPTEHSYASPER